MNYAGNFFLNALDQSWIFFRCVFIVLVVAFTIGGANDLFVDLYYWGRQLYRWLFKRHLIKPLTLDQLLSVEEKPVAIMLPAWHEAGVIKNMLLNTINTIDYRHYFIFVGVYPNDPETEREVDEVSQLFPQVVKVVNSKPGPTTKADNLNEIYHGLCEFEQSHGLKFQIVVLSDSEDVHHPLSLRLFNYLMPRFEMIQLPIIPLEIPWYSFVGGVYLDEFAEMHLKELLVREKIARVLPSAGTSTAFWREKLEELAREEAEGQGTVMAREAENEEEAVSPTATNGGGDGKLARNVGLSRQEKRTAPATGRSSQPETGVVQIFNPKSLTEDYEIGIRLGKRGARQIILIQYVERIISKKRLLRRGVRPKKIKELVATRAFFLTEFRKAMRQRARWVYGIAWQGLRNIGWEKSLKFNYALLRDRVAFFANFLYLFGYLLIIYVAVVAGVRRFFRPDFVLPPLVGRGEIWWQLALVVMFFFFWRLLMRFIFVNKVYGLGHALVTPIKMVVGNVLNIASSGLAMLWLIRALRTGREQGWIKTEHEFPAEKLEAFRRKIGDLLLSRRLITADQLEEAVRIQQKTGKKVGEILVEKGYVTQAELEEALAYSREMAAAKGRGAGEIEERREAESGWELRD
ncbi:MAG TPA: glycosyltransferase [Candidatus Saccharicenans sp.]|mgnify:CR=1 FL=1|nr:glycosyltransferase [Candidatus Saccharicenans sp.]